ncbi:hypothetical protein BN874_2910006 [Candidatus Contendobacter odensis Run_B_J11]|uniref:Uncharacterized protein n=1 Tax=Candidatus Contendobacter odensis Run_B_J11 TaxID=1400861 RepID=A0A7U7J500_9GAMM|nr:hypothetical protein BN874_2910006 [Candidatus Contendobacter odensis Run_B_J11]
MLQQVSEKARIHPNLTHFRPLADAKLGTLQSDTEAGSDWKPLPKKNLESLAYDFVPFRTGIISASKN